MAIVYLLTNLENGKLYVGKTKGGIEQRWYNHVKDAKNGSNYAIHRAIRKYGKDSFTRRILGEYQTEEEALTAEREWISKLGTMIRERGYNMCEGGHGTIGFRFSEEQRARRAEMAKSYWDDPEFRAKCTASGSITINRPEVRAKLAELARTPERRAKQSALSKEIQARPDVRAKSAAAFKATTSTAEGQRRIAEGGRKRSETFAARTHCRKGHEMTPENTYRREGSDFRDCRKCAADRAREKRIPHPKVPKTHCIRGHEFTEENTIHYTTKRGTAGRACRACSLDRRKALYRAARNAGLSVAEARDVRDGKATLATCPAKTSPLVASNEPEPVPEPSDVSTPVLSLPSPSP